jgi:outer membrane protein TolC
MRKERHTQQGSWRKPKTKTTASRARERNGVMTRLEELEAKRAAAEAAVNAAADTAWDEAAAAYAAYDAAWDAVDAYKAELKKQGEIIP